MFRGENESFLLLQIVAHSAPMSLVPPISLEEHSRKTDAVLTMSAFCHEYPTTFNKSYEEAQRPKPIGH